MLAGEWVPTKSQQIDFDKLPRVPVKHVVVSDVRAKGNSPAKLDLKNAKFVKAPVEGLRCPRSGIYTVDGGL